jgi:hypothetical protein
VNLDPVAVAVAVPVVVAVAEHETNNRYSVRVDHRTLLVPLFEYAPWVYKFESCFPSD